MSGSFEKEVAEEKRSPSSEQKPIVCCEAPLQASSPYGDGLESPPDLDSQILQARAKGPVAIRGGGVYG